MEMSGWWKTHYPDLYRNLVHKLTEEDKADPLRQYHKATHDMHYDKLDAKWVQYFLSAGKMKTLYFIIISSRLLFPT